MVKDGRKRPSVVPRLASGRRGGPKKGPAALAKLNANTTTAGGNITQPPALNSDEEFAMIPPRSDAARQPGADEDDGSSIEPARAANSLSGQSSDSGESSSESGDIEVVPQVVPPVPDPSQKKKRVVELLAFLRNSHHGGSQQMGPARAVMMAAAYKQIVLTPEMSGTRGNRNNPLGPREKRAQDIYVQLYESGIPVPECERTPPAKKKDDGVKPKKPFHLKDGGSITRRVDQLVEDEHELSTLLEVTAFTGIGEWYNVVDPQTGAAVVPEEERSAMNSLIKELNQIHSLKAQITSRLVVKNEQVVVKPGENGPEITGKAAFKKKEVDQARKESRNNGEVAVNQALHGIGDFKSPTKAKEHRLSGALDIFQSPMVVTLNTPTPAPQSTDLSRTAVFLALAQSGNLGLAPAALGLFNNLAIKLAADFLKEAELPKPNEDNQGAGQGGGD
jgi:hypothetical protein